MVWVLGLWPAFMNNNPLGDREDYVLQKRQAWVRAFIQEQLWLWKGEKKIKHHKNMRTQSVEWSL